MVAKFRTVCVILLMMAWLFAPAHAASAADHKRDHGITSSTTIDAPKSQVWQALISPGNFDDKLIEKLNDREAIVEQRFKSLPMLSAIVVTVRAKIQPEDRIDFDMIKSEHLKNFAGIYTLSAVSPKKTRVQLTMFIDPGLPVPRFLVNKFVDGKVKSRLKRIKMFVEKGSAG